LVSEWIESRKAGGAAGWMTLSTGGGVHKADRELESAGVEAAVAARPRQSIRQAMRCVCYELVRDRGRQLTVHSDGIRHSDLEKIGPGAADRRDKIVGPFRSRLLIPGVHLRRHPERERTELCAFEVRCHRADLLADLNGNSRKGSRSCLPRSRTSS